MRYIKRDAIFTGETVKKLERDTGLPAVLARMLAARGISDSNEAEEFLCPSREQLYDPFLFDAMRDAVELIREMVEADVPIAVYSDYDCDGVCGAAIIKKTLECLGADARVYIPDRFTEGYGTNPAAMEMLADEAGLIITVDCGITSVSDVALARDMGAEVIILDHHECGELPDTPYILNPKRPGEKYPGKELCGAGIAFKLAQALLGEKAFEYIDVAGTATIGDIVSLTGENRAIAALGIEKLRKTPCCGLKQLALEAGTKPEKLDSYSVSFRLVPRLNVAGRLEHAYRALDLLMSDSDADAELRAGYLNELNERRRTIQKSITELAEQQVIADGCADRVLMIRGKDFHKGVVGLAASSLAEKFCRPAIVLCEENGMLTGSARSIDGVNIYELMSAASDLYTKFGGHSQAAGVTMPKAVFEEARKRINDCACSTVDDELFLPSVVYDEQITPQDATEQLAELIERMQPFGQDNPSPVFLMRDVSVTNAAKMGKNSEHARARAEDLRIVRFGGELSEGGVYTMCGTLGINEFNSKKTVQFLARVCEKKTDRELKYIRSFLREACALDARSENMYTDRNKFFSEFNAEGGAAVMAVYTKAGENAIKACMQTCSSYDDTVPKKPEKCIIYLPKEIPSWCESLYLCASPALLKKYPDARLLMDEKSRDIMLKTAAEFFVRKEKLEDYLEAFKATKGEYASISALLTDAAAAADGGMEDMWFALNVFFEQKLIAFAKGDKISLIYKNGSINAEKSSLYSAFCGLLKGGTA